MSKIDRLEIRQLRLLQALLRERNVSRVASQIGLTQQAVSDQLRKIRDIFDDRLFVRKSNGLVPTPLAEQLSEKIEHILIDVEQLITPAIFDPALVTGHYSIAATDYAQQIILPVLLSLLRTRAPGLRVTIRDLDVDSIQDQMANGMINLAIAFPDITPSSYPSITLFTEQHVCVAAATSPLHQRKVSMAELACYPQIAAYPSRPNFRGSLHTWFSAAGLSPNIVISAPCFSVVPGYLDTTDTIAFLPARAISDGKLKVLDIDKPPAEFEVIATWHPRSSQDSLHNWIIDILRQSSGKL